MQTNSMSTEQTRRLAALLPANVPRYVRCYDMGGYGDRYTVCFTGKAAVEKSEHRRDYPYRAMSAAPFHPQGVGLWGATPNRPCDVNKSGFAPAIGRKNHLGKRIPFAQLPEDCRKLVLSDYKEIWKLA